MMRPTVETRFSTGSSTPLWNDTGEAIDAAGWMHTGDLATIDAEGYCNIVGRSKDMVIRGGENIYPREVEEFLYRHPKVQAPLSGQAAIAFSRKTNPRRGRD